MVNALFTPTLITKEKIGPLNEKINEFSIFLCPYFK